MLPDSLKAIRRTLHPGIRLITGPFTTHVKGHYFERIHYLIILSDCPEKGNGYDPLDPIYIKVALTQTNDKGMES